MKLIAAAHQLRDPWRERSTRKSSFKCKAGSFICQLMKPCEHDFASRKCDPFRCKTGESLCNRIGIYKFIHFMAASKQRL